VPVAPKWFPPSWVQIKATAGTIYIDPAYLTSYFENHPTRIDFSKRPDEIDGRTVYHAGDTDLIPEMRRLRDVDVALLPIGGRFTMEVDEAVEAAVQIRPQLAIPMHTLKRADPREFVAKLEARRSRVAARAPGIGDPVHDA
jgi:hypothetical protein